MTAKNRGTLGPVHLVSAGRKVNYRVVRRITDGTTISLQSPYFQKFGDGDGVF